MGTFNAKNLSDGERAHVLVRPEAFRLELAREVPLTRDKLAPYGDEDHPNFRPEKDFAVTSARTLGRVSLVSFIIPLEDGTEIGIEARVSGIFLPQIHSRVTATVNSKQAFVFPLSATS